ncbi:hypothetical protein D1007_62351 [Hordeum vulgare]|nr:hypothetical protein D1007_62351 [Hordeum vulgare]
MHIRLLRPHNGQQAPAVRPHNGCSPLYPERCTTILPPVPDTSLQDGLTYYQQEIILNDGGEGLSSIYLWLGSKTEQTVVDVYVLQDDIWAIYFSSVSEITNISLQFPSLIGGGKIYNLASVGEIVEKLLVLDLVSLSFSLVNLPEEVSTWCGRLSHADDSGVHLTHVEDYQIRIWLHMIDSKGVANWFLVNTICLHEIFRNHMIPIPMSDDYYRGTCSWVQF